MTSVRRSFKLSKPLSKAMSSAVNTVSSSSLTRRQTARAKRTWTITVAKEVCPAFVRLESAICQEMPKCKAFFVAFAEESGRMIQCCSYCFQSLGSPLGTGVVLFERSFCSSSCTWEYRVSCFPRGPRMFLERRDTSTCQRCLRPTDGKWEADHVEPICEAACRRQSLATCNLQVLCIPCHKKKSSDEKRSKQVERS